MADEPARSGGASIQIDCVRVRPTIDVYADGGRPPFTKSSILQPPIAIFHYLHISVSKATRRQFADQLYDLLLTAEMFLLPWPKKKNRYSRDIHEIDPQCDHVISCDIDFDLQRELTTRRGRASRRCRTELDIAQYHMIEL